MSTRNTRMEQRPPRREPVPKRKLDAPAGKFKPAQQDADALKALRKAARTMKRSAALWLQPKHLRAVACNLTAAEHLHAVCEQVINGHQLPVKTKRWLYVHKVVALSKLSNHQQDIEQRVRAREDGDPARRARRARLRARQPARIAGRRSGSRTTFRRGRSA